MTWIFAHDVDRAAPLKTTALGVDREDRERVVVPVGKVERVPRGMNRDLGGNGDGAAETAFGDESVQDQTRPFGV